MRFEIHWQSDDQHFPLNGTWSKLLTIAEVVELARDYDLRGRFDGEPLDSAELEAMRVSDVLRFDGDGCGVTIARK